MIKLQDMTPEVYYQRSRDFQFIGRLYDIVLNSVKTNADMIYSLPLSDNSDTKLIDLMTMTLGFKSKHNYNIKQLTALCSAFAYIIQNKGNMTAIETACNVLAHAEGVKAKVVVEQERDSTGLLPKLNIYVPEALTDLNLLKDLLNYIIPAGMQIAIYVSEVQSAGFSSSMVSTDTVHFTTTTDKTLYSHVVGTAPANPNPSYMNGTTHTVQDGFIENAVTTAGTTNTNEE